MTKERGEFPLLSKGDAKGISDVLFQVKSCIFVRVGLP